MTTRGVIVKSFDSPDETWSLPGRARVDVVRLGSVTVGRGTAEPGWRWSTHVKPLAGTELCEETHVGVVLSGREAVRMADGTEVELTAGDAFVVGAGHDAWVVGDEPCVSIDLLDLAPAPDDRVLPHLVDPTSAA
jgi:quercetin dioxygenase-like cupin family protein